MLSRVHGRGFREAVAVGMRVLPERVQQQLGHVQFVCGVDPVFIGLHTCTTTDDGRSYRDTAHCCYGEHLPGPRDRKVTTIVLPRAVHPAIVTHELGHALDAVLGFQHVADPVTEYAKTNRCEAFAEAVVSWRWRSRWMLQLSERDQAFFDMLA